MRWVWGGLLASCLALTSTAWAIDLGSDEVTLKNGGSVRGTVVNVEPGTKVVILEAGQSEPRTIAWGEVADVQKGKYAENQTAQPGPAGPGFESLPAEPADEAPPSGKGVVKVHIESDEPVNLLQQTASAAGVVGRYGFVVTRIDLVCHSPCDTVVDARKGLPLFIGGDGVRTSSTLTLADREGDVTLKVDAGSDATLTFGILGLTLGGAGVAGGALMFGLGALGEDSSGLNIGGGISLGVGAALMTTGIVLLATGGTDVEIVDGAPKKTARGPAWWRGEF